VPPAPTPTSPLPSPAGYGLLYRLLVQPAAQALLGSDAVAGLSAAAAAQLCSGCQACVLLVALAGIGYCLYIAELRERHAFLAALLPAAAPTTPAPAHPDPQAHLGTARKDGKGDNNGSGDDCGGGSAVPRCRQPIPADLACASEYWLSFALPAVCGLYTYSVAGQ
jgi:hypothetical protein